MLDRKMEIPRDIYGPVVPNGPKGARPRLIKITKRDQGGPRRPGAIAQGAKRHHWLNFDWNQRQDENSHINSDPKKTHKPETLVGTRFPLDSTRIV